MSNIFPILRPHARFVVIDANRNPSADAGNAPQRLQRSHSGSAEAAQQLQDLTFVNMTDPRQSKSHESRKVVRRQVMVNFAREKRLQQKPSSPDGAQFGISSSNTVSGVQELLNAAMPNAEDAGMIDWSLEKGASDLGSPGHHSVSNPATPKAQAPARRSAPGLESSKSGPHPPAAQPFSSPVNGITNSPGVGISNWPVDSETHVPGLLNHCKTGSLPSYWPAIRHPNVLLLLGHSFLFRACHPQYMISLLSNRPSAENYPFFVDVDCDEDVNQEYGTKNAVQSELYWLAEGSSMLAHALLMVSASHLAIIESGDGTARTRQAIDHKSKALQLLNEAIKGLPGDNYLDTLATIAVLASHEVSVVIRTQ